MLLVHELIWPVFVSAGDIPVPPGLISKAKMALLLFLATNYDLHLLQVCRITLVRVHRVEVVLERQHGNIFVVLPSAART